MKKQSITTAVLALVLLLSAAFAAAASDELQVYFNDPQSEKRDNTIQNMILNDIRAAEESINIATYNFSDTKTAEALVDAVDRGVEVNLVIDQGNYDGKVMDTLKAGGVAVVPSNSDGLMHAKYIVIDDRITISGSANMTLSSFSYDNNYMIRIDNEELALDFNEEFAEMFYDGYFGSSSPHTKAAAGVTLDDGTKIYVRFSPDDGIDDLIEQLIAAAQESVYVLAYSFASEDIGERLIDADANGLDVVGICEDTKAYTDTGGQCPVLAEAGLAVYVDGYEDTLMHEKALILDNQVVIAGSYNLTRAADRRNDEQILIIQSPEEVDQFLAEFDKILEDAL